MVVSPVSRHVEAGLSAVAIQPLDEDIVCGVAELLKDDLETGRPGGTFEHYVAESVRDYFWLNDGELARWEERLGFRVSEGVRQHLLRRDTFDPRPPSMG